MTYINVSFEPAIRRSSLCGARVTSALLLAETARLRLHMLRLSAVQKANEMVMAMLVSFEPEACEAKKALMVRRRSLDIAHGERMERMFRNAQTQKEIKRERQVIANLLRMTP